MRNEPFALRQRQTPGAILDTSWKISAIGIGLVALIFVLFQAQIIIKPVSLAIVIGLMFGPVADRLERAGLPSALSAACVLLLLILVAFGALFALAMPLSGWLQRLPEMWANLQNELASWQGLLATIERLQENLRSFMSTEDQVVVSVDDNSAMINAAFIAPAILAQIAMFLVSTYFFLATRHEIKHLVLSLCLTRRMRLRMARVFVDVERRISRYLLSITGINIGLGIAVTLAMWIAGVPSPLLWGMLAAVLNYVVYIGSVVMVAILLGVGLVIGDSLVSILTPAAIYLILNFIEAQFISPAVVGRFMRINPFFIFLALTFWIWLWGPIGGFVAVPAVIITMTLISHVFGPVAPLPHQPRRR